MNGQAGLSGELGRARGWRGLAGAVSLPWPLWVLRVWNQRSTNLAICACLCKFHWRASFGGRGYFVFYLSCSVGSHSHTDSGIIFIKTNNGHPWPNSWGPDLRPKVLSSGPFLPHLRERHRSEQTFEVSGFPWKRRNCVLIHLCQCEWHCNCEGSIFMHVVFQKKHIIYHFIILLHLGRFRFQGLGPKMWYVPFGLGELGGLVAGVAVGSANEVDE